MQPTATTTRWGQDGCIVNRGGFGSGSGEARPGARRSVERNDMNVHAMDAGGKVIPDCDGACVRMFPPDDVGAGPRAGPGTGCGREGWEGGVRG